MSSGAPGHSHTARPSAGRSAVWASAPFAQNSTRATGASPRASTEIGNGPSPSSSSPIQASPDRAATTTFAVAPKVRRARRPSKMGSRSMAAAPSPLAQTQA